MKCPGTDLRFLKAEEVKCACGSTVEVFSDEPSAKCRKCGRTAYKKLASCIDWCMYAEKCTGKGDGKADAQ